MTEKRAKRLHELGKGEFVVIHGLSGSELLFHFFGKGTFHVKSYLGLNSADRAKERLLG